MAFDFAGLFNFTSKSKSKKGGVARTPTFDPGQQTGLITSPLYREHLTDLFQTRAVQDSRELMKLLFTQDPDVSAAVNSYLTMANTDMLVYAVNLDGEIDGEATRQLELAIKLITHPTDYALGFQLKPDMRSLSESLRWMLLLRGAVGIELVFSDKLQPEKLRNVDMASVEWLEKKPGEYKPQQAPPNSADKISLDIPTFFVGYFRRDPTTIYGYPFFAAAINTIAARQQVINDLYRIMQITGYPRLDISVLEEIILKSAPAGVKTDREKLREWTASRIAEIRAQLQSMRPDQPFVHSDAVAVKIINERNPGAGLDISAIIDTLNAQNQAGLKSMATILGRGTQGVNTSSVEARIAAMNADELNYPIAEVLSKALSFILHQNGFQGWAVVRFAPAELRPDLELEPQRVLLASRLRTDLSLGLITDDEYHLRVHGRVRPKSAPELSGTNFENAASASVDAQDISPNSDPLGRSMSGEGSKMARSNGVQQGAAP